MALAQFPSVQIERVFEAFATAQPACAEMLIVGPYDFSGISGDVVPFTFETELGSLFVELPKVDFRDVAAVTPEEFAVSFNRVAPAANVNARVSVTGAGTMLFETTTTGPDAFIGGFGSPTAYGSAGETGQLVINRIPEPGEVEIALTSRELSFQIFDVGGGVPDLNTFTIRVNGELAFTNGGPGIGYTVNINPVMANPSVLHASITRDDAFRSHELVEVVVEGSALPITGWYFVMKDVTHPSLEDASARDVQTLHVTFSEPMSDSVLLPDNYTLRRVSTFAVEVMPVAVERLSAERVAVRFDMPLTFGATYELLVADVADARGNPIDIPPADRLTFNGFNPQVPEGRRFLLWDFIPEKNKREDSSRDLFRAMSVMQEVTNVLLHEVDRMADLIDPDLAPEVFVDAMLADLGNPFPSADLSHTEKRRLLGVLVAIYKLKGTIPGIVNAARFLLGVGVQIVPPSRSGWLLGEGELGTATTTLGIETRYQLYSFDVIVDTQLTALQRQRLIDLIDFMKSAHEHLVRLIEPAGPYSEEVLDHLVLGYSQLGVNWLLH